MPFLILAFGAVLVVMIAVYSVNRASARLTNTEAMTLYSTKDAIKYISDNLPKELSDRLDSESVEFIIAHHLKYFRIKGAAHEGNADDLAVTAGKELADFAERPVLHEDEAVDFVMEGVLGEGWVFDALDVVVVLDLNLQYLQSIGALGENANTPDPDSD